MGDQETLACVKNPKYHEGFLTMCPTYTFINRADGLFNKDMGFQKDYAAILSSAYLIDVLINKYLTNPEEEGHYILTKLGLLHSSGEKSGHEKYMEQLVLLLSDTVKKSFKNRFFSDIEQEFLAGSFTEEELASGELKKIPKSEKKE